MPEVVKITLEAQFAPFLNLALHQRKTPILESLKVTNQGDTLLEELIIVLSCADNFILQETVVIPKIAVGATYTLPPVQLQLQVSYLAQLTEKEINNINISITYRNETIFQKSYDVTLMPFDYFGGFRYYPESIANYVTPNHPYVFAIKQKTSAIMEANKMSPSFTGYQMDRADLVYKTLGALYQAVQQEDIIYSSLPPSFEEAGQRLRLLDSIQQLRFANCIDLSLLFAACLEAMDLHPIIIITQGHAFVGCWLHEEKFATIINDDRSAITKRFAAGIKEIAIFEATAVCKGNNIDFNTAVNDAETQLIGVDRFILSVDIKKARISQYLPLPLKTNQQNTLTFDETDLSKSKVNRKQTLSDLDLGTIIQEENTNALPITKQKIWERKLLDLSLRNNLLSLSMSRNYVQLVDISLHDIEDQLADGKTLSIHAVSQQAAKGIYNQFYQPLHSSDPNYLIAQDELKHKRLLSYHCEEDLEYCLTYISRNAKSAIEENGSSTLYLALGFLRWYDLNNPDKERYAPILLIPIEISRRSVKSKFSLKSREEDTIINITLLEYLKQEYQLDLNFLEELPQDENGIDTRKVFALFRRAIMQQKNWDIEESLVLGNFSFHKLILWKDIVSNSDRLRQNPFVNSLMEGQMTWQPPIETSIAQHELDAKIHPKQLILPIPADVSQLQAIIAANNNQSFVLHGPPGTGKSQTITNIIANALYNQKRVLFVSAKKAALDVVYKRLENIGLAPYCLELHSNKTKKSEILSYFERTLSINKIYNNLAFEENANQLFMSQNDLNNLVASLHKKQHFGKSIYECILECENFKDQEEAQFDIPNTELQGLYPQRLQQWLQWIEDYSIIAHKIDNSHQHPLVHIGLQHYPYNIEQNIGAQVTKVQNAIELLYAANASINIAQNSSQLEESKANLQGYYQCMQLCINIEHKWVNLVTYIWNTKDIEVLQAFAAHYANYLTLQQEVEKKYHPDVIKLDISVVELEYNQAQATWFLPKYFKLKAIKNKLQPYYKNGKLMSEFIPDMLQLVRRYQKQNELVQQAIFLPVRQLFESYNIINEKQIKELTTQTEVTLVSKKVLGNIKTKDGQFWLRAILKDTQAFVEDIFAQTQAIQKACDAYQIVQQELETLHTITQYNKTHLDNTQHYIETISKELQQILTHLPKLKDWTVYQHAIQQAKQIGIASATQIKQTNNSNLQSHQALSQSIKLRLYKSIIHHTISTIPQLQKFDKIKVEQAIRNYLQQEQQQSRIAPLQLHNFLVEKIPNSSFGAIGNSELGILQRNIRSKGRGTSIRKLFDQIPQILPRLAPCMLMSPISVAQYFTMQPELFDLVIFDEASQLPTCESVGALARAKSAIIVGDPKQMPPTSFFSTNRIDEDNIDLEDLDSILDDSLALSIPSKYLLKHYRSQHESLISFSNAQYYDHKLLTFPSADDLKSKVIFHKIEGSYDKGKTRQNKIEAEAVVQEIARRLQDPDLVKQTIGVVTFSQTQQTLIEDLLQKMFFNYPNLELLSMQMKEPIFIKNLENVQGDERDIILFSIGYGPDASGQLSMNFGPLNRDGGWRRLNVAVTRAKAEMHIFSTITSDQIDLRRTSAEGVLGLKAFLHFAEKGQLPENVHTTQTALDFDLNQKIAMQLRNKGLDVKTNIGNSEFKLDIGIIHPKEPNTYILGILIDGPNYYNAGTTNDREIVTPNVLANLGWNMYRIWAMDWFINAEQIIMDICNRIEQLLEVPHKTAANTIVVQEDIIMEHITIEEKKLNTKLQPYQLTTLPLSNELGADAFLNAKHREIIKSQILKIVQNEAPISLNVLTKRLMEIWGIARKGNRTTLHILQLIGDLKLKITDFEDQTFVWSFKTLPNQINFYRNSDEYKRNLEDVAPEEITIALKESIEQHIAVHKEDLIKYTNKAFGNTKITDLNAQYLTKIIEQLLTNQEIKIEKDLIML